MKTLLFMISLATAIFAPVSSDTPVIWQPPDMSRMPDRSIVYPGMFPHIAVIWMEDLHPQWNGFIFDENRIITIADSLLRGTATIRPDWLCVRVGGVSWRDAEGEIYAVESVRFHPEYQNEEGIVTIAVLKVSRPISWSHVVKPIAIAAVPENPCQMCRMITRGDRGPTEEQSYFEWDTVAILDRRRCNTDYRQEPKPNELCFFSVFQNLRVTEFDIGLPISCNGSVVGMLNTEDDDSGPRDPSKMLVLSEYTEWIYSNETLD